jgi:uncharacterized membrane protein YdjX (TVP38/TMEM64 family)
MTKKQTINKLWRPIILILIVITVFILTHIFHLGDKFYELRGWIESLGAWGPLAFVIIYILAVIASIPGSAITIAAGAIFGSIHGIIIVSIGSTIGAGLAFLISRYFARESITGWLGKRGKFRELDRLTKTHGGVIVALTRLVPVFPFNLLNYGFGLTGVGFGTYLFWSWLCMLPGTVLYVVGADAIAKGVTEGKVPWSLVAIFTILIILIGFIVLFARRQLGTKEDD